MEDYILALTQSHFNVCFRPHHTVKTMVVVSLRRFNAMTEKSFKHNKFAKDPVLCIKEVEEEYRTSNKKNCRFRKRN